MEAEYGRRRPDDDPIWVTWLAEALLQANEPERAAEAATRALRLSRLAGSNRADERVGLVRRELRRFKGVPAVDAFEDEAAA